MYNKDGELTMELLFSNGIPNGIWKTYSGMFYIEIPYVSGKVHGIMKTYSNGKLLSESAFTEGIVSNASKTYSYWPNGNLSMEIFSSPENGWTKFYFEDGSLRSFMDKSTGITYNYKNGKLESSYGKDFKTTYYNENNQPKATQQNGLWDRLMMVTEILAGVNAANVNTLGTTSITDELNKNTAIIDQMEADQYGTKTTNSNSQSSNTNTYNTVPNVTLSQQQPTTANSGYSNSTSNNSSSTSTSTSTSSGSSNSGSSNTIGNNSGGGQKYAKSCGAECRIVTATISSELREDCKLLTYVVTNNSSDELSVCLYIETNTGWHGDYYFLFNLTPGNSHTFRANNCDTGSYPGEKFTGRYYIYYAPANTTDKFPKNNEVGTGNY